MRDFEDIKIVHMSTPQAARNDPDEELKSLDFVIRPMPDNSWIRCFERVYFSYLSKEEPFRKDSVFINPKLNELNSRQINSLEWTDPKGWTDRRQFSIEWPKSIIEDPKTYQEIRDFMNKWVSEANDCYAELEKES